MALSVLTSLDEIEHGGDTSLTTNSVSPTANALLAVFVTGASASVGTTFSDTLTGTGSWTTIEAVTTTDRLCLTAIGYAIAGATPGSGTVTATFNEETTKIWMNVCECTGHDTSTPVQQSKTGEGTGASLTITLDSATASTSMVAGVLVDRQTSANPTNGTGFTELENDKSASGGGYFTWSDTQYDLASTDTTCDWSGLASTENGAAVIEINEAAAGGSNILPQIMQHHYG